MFFFSFAPDPCCAVFSGPFPLRGRVFQPPPRLSTTSRPRHFISSRARVFADGPRPPPPPGVEADASPATPRRTSEKKNENKPRSPPIPLGKKNNDKINEKGKKKRAQNPQNSSHSSKRYICIHVYVCTYIYIYIHRYIYVDIYYVRARVCHI